MTQPRIRIYPSRKWPNAASGRRRSQMILLIASMGSYVRARNTPRPRLWDLTAAAFPPALQPGAQPRPPDRCFFLGSKKTRQSFIHKLKIGVCTRPPSTRRHFSSIFALSSPGYPLAEAATNLIIKERLDAVLAHAFVMHQRIKLIFQ